MRNIGLAALCVALILPSVGLAQSSSAKDAAVAQRLAEAKAAAACTPTAITCGSTVSGTLSPGGCTLSDGSLVNYYSFSGTTAEQVTGALSSAAFTPVLDLINPSGDTLTSSSPGPSSVQVQSALNATGTWTWGVTDIASTESGAYSFQFTCGGSTPTCTGNSTTLCLENGRFQVRATYDAGASGSGNAQVVQLTSDTGYMWFFESSNVEAVIKVLDGCAVDSAYWVFAGGLTNVNVVLTVTDTQTGKSKTYTNPANTEFEPIQDTDAFTTCP